jgi:hypothetical protein
VCQLTRQVRVVSGKQSLGIIAGQRYDSCVPRAFRRATRGCGDGFQRLFGRRGGTMALPKLSDADRAAALKKAAEARQKRAALRQQLKSGNMSFADAMKKSDDPVVARMKVITLLESLPGFGKAKAEKLMSELEISESRRVQGLGARQREHLMERLG